MKIIARAWMTAVSLTLVAVSIALLVQASHASAEAPDSATREVDVVVVGGSAAAVAAAAAAADRWANVRLLAPRPYLGDDLCGSQRLWLEPGEVPASDLARSLFPAGRVTTPLVVKKTLDQALIARGVSCLTGAHAIDVLRDRAGRVRGVVAVSRSGREEIRAKVVIDATRHVVVARLAGAAFRPFMPGEREFGFVVVGGALKSGPDVTGREMEVTFRNPGTNNPAAYPVFSYAVRVPVPDGGFPAFAKAGQLVRDRVYGEGMKDASEYAEALPSDTIVGEARVDGDWPGIPGADPAAFRPRGAGGLFVLGVYADLSPQAQRSLQRPLTALAAGAWIGRLAAEQARTMDPAAEGVAPAGRALPVLGRYDVVIAGGGTAGAPAGIAAARAGARTLVVEYLDELGGVGTAGLIAKYWYGRREGFTREVDEALGGKESWNALEKADWLRRELGRSGADVWFETFAYGSIVTNGRVTGIAVATPFGPGIVEAGAVVDATGNADIAAAAGAATEFGLSAEGVPSAQLAGHPRRNLGDNYVNTCFALLDDTDARDVWHLMASTRASADPAKIYDVGQLPDSRERRRIVADAMLTAADILNRRTFPDTISHHRSNFDAAAFPTTPMLLVKDMKGPAFETDLPYRSLLPRGLDGILVTGLGAGVERDAMTLVRMQPDLQNQGYAAGTAAAMAAELGGRTRSVDIRKLQAVLVEAHVVEARVLTDKDSHPMSSEALARAVEQVGALRGEIRQSRTVEDPAIFAMAAVVAHREASLPLLREALAHAPAGGVRLTYARILGALGDRAGAGDLAAAVDACAVWDKGYALTSDREKNNTFSELDRLVIALGLGGAPEGVAPIVAKLGQLTPVSEVSHFHAVAMALRRHGRVEAAAAPLVRLLAQPGFTGHAVTEAARPASDGSGRVLVPRRTQDELNAALRELLAAGMLVRCGDRDGRGRAVLEPYLGDLHGHFAAFARSVLAEPGR